MSTPTPGLGPGSGAAELAGLRVPYTVGFLDEGDLAATPLAQFQAWFADAVEAGLVEPNAMALATADAQGAPSVRTVLLKQADARGFVFYTGYSSRKGTELTTNPRAALAFAWLALQRQVCVRGDVERASPQESAAYFASRPWGSRIGAWASRQSQPLAERSVLERRWAQLAESHPDHGRDDDVPLPPHWGGFVLRPAEVEFWQGRPSRLHDRLVYVAVAGGSRMLDDAASWRVERRQP